MIVAVVVMIVIIAIAPLPEFSINYEIHNHNR